MSKISKACFLASSKIELKTQNFFHKVYKIVKQIPRGKVATYGQIAKILQTRDARRVGWAMHANKDLKVPCHRVVNKEGKLAKSFSFEGWEEQKRRLEREGIRINGNKVCLEKYLYRNF